MTNEADSEYIRVNNLDDFRRMLVWTNTPEIQAYYGLKVEKIVDNNSKGMLNISALGDVDTSLSLAIETKDEETMIFGLKISDGFCDMNFDQQILALAIVTRYSHSIPDIEYSSEKAQENEKKIKSWLGFFVST